MRAEIARRTGLSRSTVSEIVTTLMATKLVAETGVGASRGGRRPVVLTFQDQARVILGVGALLVCDPSYKPANPPAALRR